MIIAIDGPAGSGKGTIASYLALTFNLIHLDTGALYRALAKAVLQAGIDPANRQAVAKLAESVTIEDTNAPDLRGEAVAAVASQIAVIPEVRRVLNDLQRQFCNTVSSPYQGVVLDGRDIGTVICPDADCKLFVTAQPEVRNQRRLLETQGTPQDSAASLNQVAQTIAERDQRDATRKIAPLTPAPDAYIIDTSDLTIDDACTSAASYVTAHCVKNINSNPVY
jgi:cytidylate kinase